MLNPSVLGATPYPPHELPPATTVTPSMSTSSPRTPTFHAGESISVRFAMTRPETRGSQIRRGRVTLLPNGHQAAPPPMMVPPPATVSPVTRGPVHVPSPEFADRNMLFAFVVEYVFGSLQTTSCAPALMSSVRPDMADRFRARERNAPGAGMTTGEHAGLSRTAWMAAVSSVRLSPTAPCCVTSHGAAAFARARAPAQMAHTS